MINKLLHLKRKIKQTRKKAYNHYSDYILHRNICWEYQTLLQQSLHLNNTFVKYKKKLHVLKIIVPKTELDMWDFVLQKI